MEFKRTYPFGRLRHSSDLRGANLEGYLEFEIGANTSCIFNMTKLVYANFIFEQISSRYVVFIVYLIWAKLDLTWYCFVTRNLQIAPKL
jgi:hypothetical protein